MSWVTLLLILIAWPLVGLAVAYLFGRFIGGGEAPESASDLIPPVVSYMRRNKRPRTSSRLRSAAQFKSPRKATGQRLH
jgi:hypothetical protein